jgi:hypothetical protein
VYATCIKIRELNLALRAYVRLTRLQHLHHQNYKLTPLPDASNSVSLGREMLSKDTFPENARTPCFPQLPPEIWMNIFQFHTSLTHLWTTCRQVSSTLRACVEHTFSTLYLEDIHILFYVDRYNPGDRARFQVGVGFGRLGTGESKELAWFSEEKEIERTEQKRILNDNPARIIRWEQNIGKMKPEFPAYTIRIGTMINDTALPGLKVDVKKREISFEWRKALDLFFREEVRRETLYTRWKAESALPLGLGQVQDPEIVQFGMRRLARRTRVHEAYAHDERMAWATASLQHFRPGPAAILSPDLPGAGPDEKWFGSADIVQDMYLDEAICLNRIQNRLRDAGAIEER